MTQSFEPHADILLLRDEAQINFHERAAQAARTRFGRKVFVRGVVEVSNFCRENCAYCGMRRDNRNLSRFRSNHEQLAELLIHHRPESITDINIQAGEDPVAVREVVLPLIKTLRRETALGISVCLGSLSHSLYAELKNAGASIYIIKFEIADPVRYAAMQSPGKFEERLANIRHLAETGWRVSSGFISGLPGQTPADALQNLALAGTLPLDGCSVSPFIPGDESELATAPMGDIDITLNSMAAMRLMRPDWVIPSVSALNLAEPGNGYRRGLRTGANLVTINMTPSEVRENYLLYKRDRFIMTEARILSAISAEGLEVSSQSLVDFYGPKKTGEVGQRIESTA
ncbi:MAG: radical SAM protein [Akkermansiaceae bacterium]|nr:radical SAM protein [Verrucomicrobiales bacterium]